MAKTFRPHYSNKSSERFWYEVNRLPKGKQGELYLCGILLQELESRVLTWLNNEIVLERHKSKQNDLPAL